MKELHYLIVGHEAFFRSEDEAAGATVAIRFTDDRNGFLRLGKASIPVRDGTAEVQTRLIPDGVYTPRLLVEEGEILCAPLEKQGGRLFPAAPSADRINSLFLRLALLEEKADNTQKDCHSLKKAVYHTQIL